MIKKRIALLVLSTWVSVSVWADGNGGMPMPVNVLVDENVSLNFLMGHFDPATQPGFVKLERQYADRDGMYLQQPAYEAFKAMQQAAARDGVSFVIISAARNFDYQRGIWEGKWTGKRAVGDIHNISKTIKEPVARAQKILEYSAMPGSSRHHWGTDFDLNSLNNSHFASGQGKTEYDWLRTHAAEYGFCQPYSSRETRPYGYNEEKWHWSFKPLSQHYTQQAALRLKDQHIQSFLGAETAAALGVVQHYVLGVSSECL